MYFVQEFAGLFSTDNFVLVGDRYMTDEQFIALPSKRNAINEFSWLGSLASEEYIKRGERNYKSASSAEFLIIKSKTINFKIVILDKFVRPNLNISYGTSHLISKDSSGSYISNIRLDHRSNNTQKYFNLIQ